MRIPSHAFYTATPAELFRSFIIIAITIAVLLFISNQLLDLVYKFHTLADPCAACEELKNNIIINWSNLTVIP